MRNVGKILCCGAIVVAAVSASKIGDLRGIVSRERMHETNETNVYTIMGLTLSSREYINYNPETGKLKWEYSWSFSELGRETGKLK